MKTYIKKVALLPLLVITGLAYAAMSGNRIDNSTNKDMGINGGQPLVSDVQKTPDLKFKDENGFPGKRDDSYLAEMIPIVLISKVSQYVVYLKKNNQNFR